MMKQQAYGLEQQVRGLIGGAALVGLMAMQVACGGGVDRSSRADTDGSAKGTPAEANPGVNTAATTGVVTLTGCLQRDALSSELTLASVATGGAPIAVPGEARDPARPGANATPGTTPPEAEAQAQLAAASSYRLIVENIEDDEARELNEAVGKRVTVRGQLAHPAPAAGADAEVPEAGVPAGSTATGATVQGAAGELRALRVQSVRAVGDGCA